MLTIGLKIFAILAAAIIMPTLLFDSSRLRAPFVYLGEVLVDFFFDVVLDVIIEFIIEFIIEAVFMLISSIIEGILG